MINAAVLLFAFLVAVISLQGQVFISEFLASNSNGLEDEDGETPDWIELHNPNQFTIDLEGWHLTDDPDDLTKWRFPSVSIPPSGFLLVFASGKDRAVAGTPLHANFSLEAEGEYLALVAPDGTNIIHGISFPKQFANTSYGYGQQVTTVPLSAPNQLIRFLVPSNAPVNPDWHLPTFNDSAWAIGTNGLGYDTTSPGFAIRTIKANMIVSNISDAEAVLADPSLHASVFSTNRSTLNFLAGGTPGNYGGDTLFPGQASVTDDFVIEVLATITIPAPGNWTFGVNSDDGFRLDLGPFAMSWNSTRNPADTLQTFNFPAAGEYPLRLVYFERNTGAALELFAAQGEFVLWNAEHFRLVGHTNGLPVRSAPLTATAATGFAGFIQTEVGPLMLSNSASAHIRMPFTVTNPPLQSLFLRIRYDDGFAAYLDGVEVARRDPVPRPNTLTVIPQEINLTEHFWRLVEGENILAIHGMNDAPDGHDFLMSAELLEYRATLHTNLVFAIPSPGTFNTTALFARVADTTFSHDRGFYDSGFACEITTETPDTLIRYTLNGSAPTLSNGFTYAGPIAISNTTTLRAAAFKDAFQPSNVDTHTYIFLNDVVRQSTNGVAPPGWPTSWGANSVDYGMDPDIVNHPHFAPGLQDDLRSIPSLSIVTDLDHLFHPTTGIYANPRNDELAWERPTSLELIHPSGKEGFQVNCGIRIRGGFSRNPENPKHAFRFFFRQEYGESKLDYPLFGDSGAASFDKIDLRTMQNYSWSYRADERMICIRDSFSRDTQGQMGHQYTKGDFYHLYINGQYWGLYNIEERPDAAFAQTYFGGAREDYDTIKVDPDLNYAIEATDGTLDAWFRLWQAATNGFASDAAYQRVQGNNPDGTRNPAYENLLDIDNLIDYMLLIIYTGNLDAPVSTFVTPRYSVPNNFFAIRNRKGTAGFRFFAHDSEHTLLNDPSNLVTNRTGPIIAGDPTQASTFNKSNPQYLWQRLAHNPEFRLRVADHIQQHFFNAGALTPQANRARFLTRSNEIHRAIVAESARWGDAKRPTLPYTRTNWIDEINRVHAYLAQRGDIVLAQLREQNLFTDLLAPALSHHGQSVPSGYQLHMTNLNSGGTIFYTLDGSDPRQPGGTVSSNASAYAGPLTLNAHTLLRARVFLTNAWSPLVKATFFTVQDFSKLLVTEIMYNPPPFGDIPGDSFEFLELKNTGLLPLDLTGLTFSGINFTFPEATLLAPGEFFLLARNNTIFTNKYPNARVDGIYGGRLNNAGETLALAHPLGSSLFSFDYNNTTPWPVAPDAHGFSLVPKDPNHNPRPTKAENWRASTFIGGSPGTDDPPAVVPTIYINELSPELDLVELYNPNDFTVDLSGWLLSTNRDLPTQFRISGVIDPAGYRVFNLELNDFGGEVYLFSADSETNLTGYSHGFRFAAVLPGGSLGRYLNSAGDEQLVRQITASFGSSNLGPGAGPIVLSQIMYHPPDDALGFDNSDDEYLVFSNIAPEPVSLAGWELRDAVEFIFPPDATLDPGTSLIVVSFDPADTTKLNAFRARYLLLQNFPIHGPYLGKLDNSSESIELYSPTVEMERVKYFDLLPWPPAADGTGAELRRTQPSFHGNDATNWQSVLPLTLTTQPQSTNVLPGRRITFSVSGFGAGSLRYQWLFNDTSIPNETNSTFIITSVQSADEGDYSVLVSDPSGSGISASARLVVLAPPAFVKQPQTQTVFVGDNATFRVSTIGTMPMGYRWRRIGSGTLLNYPGAPEITLSNVQLTLNGSRIDCIATNLASSGGVASAMATLYVVADADGDRMPDTWENQNGLLANDPSDASRDRDGDGVFNRDEYIAGTDPQDAESYLQLFAQPGPPPSIVLRFTAVSNNTYRLLFADAIASNDWHQLTHFNATTTNRTILHTNLPPGHRYYRLWTSKTPEP